MNLYLVAYKNWFSGEIQFSEQEANSGLEAMKELDGIYKFNSIKDEEVYFSLLESKGGFAAYEVL